MNLYTIRHLRLPYNNSVDYKNSETAFLISIFQNGFVITLYKKGTY